MANAITLAKTFIPILDKIYKRASLTSVLDGNPELVRQGASYNEMIIPKISMQGLADYSRNGGYVNGDVTLTNETVRCNFDRGRMFQVDTMDNLETAGIAFGQLSGEFLRTKVGPELDAFRFAQYAGASGISKISAGATLADGAAVVTALRAGVNKMDEDEVDPNNRYLFITPTLYGMIRDLDTTKSKEVLETFAGIVKVPQSRFYTAIDQYDGTTSSEEAGGYVKDPSSSRSTWRPRSSLLSRTRAPTPISSATAMSALLTYTRTRWQASTCTIRPRPKEERVCVLSA